MQVDLLVDVARAVTVDPAWLIFGVGDDPTKVKPEE